MLKRLKLAYQLAKDAQQYVDMADAPDYWTPGNAAVASSFFSNDTGQRLRARLRNMVFRSAIQACQEPTNGDYERGKARGVLLAVQAIEQHLTPPPAQGGTSEVEEDEQAVL